MGHFFKSTFTTGILLLVVAATPAAAATFDGDWNVQITSKSAA